MYSIGHGNRKIEEFSSILRNYEIQILVDVRSIPYSRFHPQFRKEQLKAQINSFGIEYLFLGDELGGRPKSSDLYLEGKLDYEKVKQTEFFKKGLNKLIELHKNGSKVAIMCSELDQNCCHRKSLIADELYKNGIDVLHINKVGNTEKHIVPTQKSLFD